MSNVFERSGDSNPPAHRDWTGSLVVATVNLHESRVVLGVDFVDKCMMDYSDGPVCAVRLVVQIGVDQA